MKTFSITKELVRVLKKERDTGRSVGFVPTMGALHEGHLSLLEESKKHNDITVCSIFVNPIQFNQKQDLEKYPRNLNEDLRLLLSVDCNYVFVPTEEEVYPGGIPELNLNLGRLDRVLEGKFRPGHFKGVAIVVKQLFDIVNPDKAYFGKKDYQQLLIIQHMVSELNLRIQIIPGPTLREHDGLAMSSRNLRLTIGEREVAPMIYETLCKVRDKAGEMPVKELKQWAIRKINSNSLFQVEYLEIVDKDDLHPIGSWKEKNNAITCTAVFLGDVRLIDNIELFS
ncbi:MAG: pantoate--beta-alanine ligase [Bacteroidetes bacterium]|nr:pantoate--beta-alanine ligase [Bacteroidota bacterium]